MSAHYDVHQLQGSLFIDVGRCLDLIWWIFEKDGASYRLHTQCSCRLSKEHRQLLTQNSIYFDVIEDTDGETNDEGDKSAVPILFDELIKDVRPLFPVLVESVCISESYDLLIQCNNNIKIEVFADKPEEHEQWRFFDYNDESPHLVAYGDRLVEE